jgi:oligopeptidase B
VRGGGDMGQFWYQAGKLLQKNNTFADLIAAAELLIQVACSCHLLFAAPRSK